MNIDGRERAVGTLSKKSAQVLNSLRNASGLSLQYFLRWISGSAYEGTFSLGKGDRATSQPRWSLFVNLYGAARLAEDVGSFAEACGICLQDPEHCDRNVEYRNPHRLLRDDGAIFYTQFLQRIPSTFWPRLKMTISFQMYRRLLACVLCFTGMDDCLSRFLAFGIRSSSFNH